MVLTISSTTLSTVAISVTFLGHSEIIVESIQNSRSFIFNQSKKINLYKNQSPLELNLRFFLYLNYRVHLSQY